MLPESHPLFTAEAFLQILLEKAPPDHWVEFRAIVHQDNREKLKNLRPILIEACQVSKLEKSFDLSISGWVLEQNKKGYEIFFSVCPRLSLPRSASGHLMAGSNEHVTHAVAAWIDLDNTGWRDILKRYEYLGPSIVVSSGHGAHVYYRYDRSMPIAEAVEHSKIVTKLMGGDSTYDAARVLRLPGTSNWKSYPKAKPCELVDMSDRYFDPGRMPKESASAPAMAAQTGVPALQFVAGLPADLRNAIWGGYEAAGHYAQHLSKPGDRSEIDFRIIKDIARYGGTQAIIREIFTNPDNAISGKTLDESKAGNGEHYLSKTIEKAIMRAEIEAAYQEENYGDVLPITDSHDLANAPPLRWAVRGILPVGGMMFVTGPAKTGKSLMVTDLIMLLAGIEKDGKFLDKFSVDMPGKVLYMQAEINRSSLRHRLMRLAESRDANWRKTPHEIRFFHKPLDLSNARNQGALSGALRKFEPQYLIIDPLARFHYLNENRQGDMSRLLGAIQRLATNAGVQGTIIVHHHGKPSDGNDREGLNSIRGSSVISDWGNAHVILKKMRSDQDEKFVRVHFELRDAEEPRTMDVMRDEHLRFRKYSESDDQKGGVRKLMMEMKGRPDKDLVAAIAADLGISRDKAARLLANVKNENRLMHPENSKHIERVPDDDLPAYPKSGVDDDDDDDDMQKLEGGQG